MTQARRRAGIPTGGQFAPTNRPAATGLDLVDDAPDDTTTADDVPDNVEPQRTTNRRPLTADPELERLDQRGRRLAEHLGFDYAPMDDVDAHHGLTTTPGTFGLVSYDDGKHFVVIGTRSDGYATMPLGSEVFTAKELEERINRETGGIAEYDVRATGQSTKPAGSSLPPKQYRQSVNLHEGSTSPWGKVDYVSRRAVGIVDFSTAGHGGVKLSAERNRDIHEAWRRPGGWYEEDCEWAIVAMTFPETYSPEHAEMGRRAALNWFPDEYEIVTGEQVQPGESYVRDEQIFYGEHKADWVTTFAIAIGGRGAVERIVRDDNVTGGFRLVTGEQRMVKVIAQVGGRRSADQQKRAFLVPAADYATRGRFGFVIDPDHYEEVRP